ncbi:hypothetical protein CFOL_v3_25876 [Cephalotus follicularis]|uniref:Uncharacterized protein n=1 Tax=Cephalotus follicularis TaxID=3775 RepID=A0A1Q3CQ93_CEPFO|nr:hypothetical protein CFOL_v3_25876 [Cephalotus follicularis]
MANPGVGTKFVSVNLNKSYGQTSHHNQAQQQQHHRNNHHQSNYGPNRAWAGGHGSGGGGGGGGMVVLSRPRSSQKAGPKLSVPPPLNLPSLRKEHERFDSLGSGGGAASGGGLGSGARPTSSGLGWTKPGMVALLEKEGLGFDRDHINDGGDQGMLHSIDGVSKGSIGVYMPPSARSGVAGPLVSAFPLVEKATVLRVEDFPSLQAALPAVTGPAQKQKDGGSQKQKQVVNEELSDEQRNASRLSPLFDKPPQSQSSRHSTGFWLNENGSENDGLAGSHASKHARRQEEYFPGPLPLVKLNTRSDWADDERDTGQGLKDRGRDDGFSKSEAYWDQDFDMPRPSVLPHKPVHFSFDRRGQHVNGTGKFFSSEVPKVDPYVRDVRASCREEREENSWRASSPLLKVVSAYGAVNDRNGIGARPPTLNTEKNNKYVMSSFRDKGPNDFGKCDMGYGQGGRQPWNNMIHSFNSQGTEKNTRERYGSEQYNRYRGDGFQNNLDSKSSFSLSGKGLPVNDPILNFGREKRPFSKTEKPYIEDQFMKDFGDTAFDEQDPFSGGLVGVVKKKKDVLKQTDFHDPARESFEAELERVQKMQEQERQRIIEEQERALELARREEMERLRFAREQEERQRRLEEEAKEAAWRAEQERVEAMRRAEEQRIAREEEKNRMLMEEERRKQAAKQKLLELEERIAKRQNEVATGGSNSLANVDERISGLPKERDVSKVVDVGDWEDSERMVERITTSASSDSSGLNRPYGMGSRTHFPRDGRDGSSALMDRGKPINSWRKDAVVNGNNSTFLAPDPEYGHHSLRRDASVGVRVFPRKDFYGGAGLVPFRSYYKGGMPEPHMDDFAHLKGQRWNISGDGDHYSRNMEIESEFRDNVAEKYGDIGWGEGRSRGNAYSPYPERQYQNSEADGLYSFGRSRYRQPRVLPPLSLTSMHKSSYRNENERPGSSTFLENEMQYNHVASNETTIHTGYDSGHQENLGQHAIFDVHQENTENVTQKLDRNATPGCDSQSSLSVSSPPDSPIHLSHDDLDESGDSAVLSAGGEGKDDVGRGNEPVVLPTEAGEENLMTTTGSVSTVDDEEWTIETNEQLQEQEEYDEDEDGYQEEDEVHEGDDENIDLTQEFEDMQLEEKSSPHMMDNLVLGFNEGVEVGMPNDEFERSSRNEEITYEIQHISVSTTEEHGSFDTRCNDGQNNQPVKGPSLSSIDSSSRIFEGTEKAYQDMVIQPNSAPQTSAATELMDHVDASSCSGMSTQHPVPSGGQTVMSNVPAAPSHSEVPVKLQFGLFSGPSLIPSPVPAIQIGSIQMPLHLHPQISPSLTHMHPSQPPLFQFGQLRYTSTISQGVMPLAPQCMSFVPPSVPANFSSNQNPGGPLPMQGQDTSVHHSKNGVLPISMNNQHGLIQRKLDLSSSNVSKELNSVPARKSAKNANTLCQAQVEFPRIIHNRSMSELSSPVEDHGHRIVKNFKPVAQFQTGAAVSRYFAKGKDISGPQGQGITSGGRGKKYMFTVKNSSSKSSILAPEFSRVDSSGIQRRPRRQRSEFRVREISDKRHSTGLVSSNNYFPNDMSNSNGKGAGIPTRNGSRKVVGWNRPSKQKLEPEYLGSGPVNSWELDSGSRTEMGAGSESLIKSKNISPSGQVSHKRNICSEEDVDASLQSGIVRVFEQPGIEAPSDEDDFIEVRSKRQMLNDRREQREKEIKAKSRVSKMPRKSRPSTRGTIVSVNSNKVFSPVDGEAANGIRSDYVTTEGRGLASIQVSAACNNTTVSQPLAPIGTPAVKTDAQADMRSQTIKSHQTSSLSVIPDGGKNLASALMFENNKKVLDNVQTSLGSWGSSRSNQQVMSFTQTQLDEAMKPAQFDSRASVGDHNTSISEPSMPSSSILTKNKSLSSAASPINSLLAGEKIQFGAVTSPTVLPPSSRAVSHGIGPPGSSRLDIPIPRNLSASENDCTLFFEKDKQSNESCAHLEEAEAEAEAAASAVAVAAISSDETVGNGLGTCPVSVSDPKSYGGADIDDVAGDQKSASQSRGGEESLSVALPADLSVETPPISLWPSLPSPQNSLCQMISHFPGGPPSHFPFYDINPLLGGPIFAFGPHDESASTQSQSQKSNTPSSGPLGTWQPCHSGVDSFYGPPAGFTGPFISPSGGIPGVQGPPHMVVYNHFAPVGQFGQVGLSFTGTTYIPSGKQPDWKHNPASSAMGVGEVDMNKLNMVPGQRNPTNMPAPIQHLAPGSPLLPMASPLAMFDATPFQSAPDMSVQARWSHVAAPPVQSVPLSMPLPQQAEASLPSQFNHGQLGSLPTHVADQPLTANRFPPDTRTSTPSDSSRNFPGTKDSTCTQLPNELGLVDPSSSTGVRASTESTLASSLSASKIADAGNTGVFQNGIGNHRSGQSISSSFKIQSSQQKNVAAPQYSNSSGYQRGVGVAQKNSSGGDWSHHRMGFQGRNQSLGADKGFPASKMKQIYVAKQPTSGTPSTS